jgi:hypothetical protein
MVALINHSLPRKGIKLVRIHASGDFFSQTYFDAWLEVAKLNPQLIFYAYTKTLKFWVARLGSIPANMRLVASEGGLQDSLINQYGLRYVKVVGTNPAITPEAEAAELGLTIDHDDSLAWKQNKSFAIALHGTQPAGSQAGKAWHAIKTKGRGGYKVDYFAHYAKSGKVSAKRAQLVTA